MKKKPKRIAQTKMVGDRRKKSLAAATIATKVPRGRNDLRRKKIIGEASIAAAEESVDPISSLPDEILHHILSFIPTKFAVRTSLLSKRWKKVWSGTPSISFDSTTLTKASRNKTQNQYTALKMMSLHLCTRKIRNTPHVNTWIELAKSRNVENMVLEIGIVNYKFRDSFYINSSVKQLSVELCYTDLMIPKGSVSWKSLKKLLLGVCSISDESMAMILSGCPLIESLTLYLCSGLKVLDLSHSRSLKILEVVHNQLLIWSQGPLEIVAPHIRCLRLRNSESPCTLVDVSSLTEAKLSICSVSSERALEADFVQTVLKMLEKVQNAETLTFGGDFLEVLSLLKLRGVSFPMFNVKDLILEMEATLFQDVVPRGIERLLQNSPDVKKLTVHARTCKTKPDQCQRSEDGVSRNKPRVDSEDVTSFMKSLIENTNALEKMVVRLKKCDLRAKGFRKLVDTLSRNYNVDISLSATSEPITSIDW